MSARPFRSTLAAPLTDRRGRFSPFKAGCLALVAAPGLWLAAGYAADALGPRPLTEVIHGLGLWSIRLLFLSLAVTPLRHLLRWPQLMLVRRMLGVAAMAYALLHLAAYAADEAFDLAKVATEIALRVYLTIGFAALLGLAALGATSTDGVIRRLGGRRWQALHRLAYPVAALAVVHFFLQSKLVVAEAAVMGGLFAWLMGWRLVRRLGLARAEAAMLRWSAGLAAGAALLTALAEAAYYGLVRGVDPLLVLQANVDYGLGTTPGWMVLFIAGAAAAGGYLRRLPGGPGRAPVPHAPGR